MKEYRVVDDDRYDTFDYLADLLTELAKYGWEVKCTLGVRGQAVLLEREVLPTATYYGEPVGKENSP